MEAHLPANWVRLASVVVSTLHVGTEALAGATPWSCAVASDLPSRKAYPRAHICVSSSSRGRCFVMRSAGLDVPLTLTKATLRRNSCSCSHKVPTSKCRTLPTPRRSRIPKAAAASTCSLVSARMPRSAAKDMHPKASVAARTMANSSDSALLCAIVHWVLDQALMQ